MLSIGNMGCESEVLWWGKWSAYVKDESFTNTHSNWCVVSLSTMRSVWGTFALFCPSPWTVFTLLWFLHPFVAILIWWSLQKAWHCCFCSATCHQSAVCEECNTGKSWKVNWAGHISYCWSCYMYLNCWLRGILDNSAIFRIELSKTNKWTNKTPQKNPFEIVKSIHKTFWLKSKTNSFWHKPTMCFLRLVLCWVSLNTWVYD